MLYFFPEKFLSKNPLLSFILLLALITLSACSEKNTDQEKTVKAKNNSVKSTVKGGKNAKDLAKIVFNLIRKNSFDDYQQLVVNLEDITYYSNSALKHFSKQNKDQNALTNFQSGIDKHIKDFPGRRKKNISLIKKSFLKSRNNIIRAGGDWRNLVLSGFHVENKHTRYGVSKLNLYLNIKDTHRYYIIKIKDCMKVKRGWILTQGPLIEGISELNKKTN